MRQPLQPRDAERAVTVRLGDAFAPLTADGIAVARRQGVHLMLAATMTAGDRRQPWAAELLRELRTSAAFHERRDATLRGLLDALGAARVDALLIKGAALSHTHYPEPYLRPRADIDLLVDRSDVERAQRVLECGGWARDVESDAELAKGQRHYTKPLGAAGRVERVDLHWRIANPLVFARALSFDELRARAVPIPSLGAAARTLAPADALLLACIHRVAHHADDPAAPALLWLTDICLLVERLERLERDRFLAVAARESLRAVCRDGLSAAAERLDSSACAHLAASLPPSATEEPTERLLHTTSPFALMRADLAALASWRDRAALVREHLFPSKRYLRTKYPRWPAVLLPFAALYRIATGAAGWIKGER